MRRLSALLLLLSLFTLTAWTLEDCVEVDFNHPDCDQYVTTTTAEVTTTAVTQPEVTTTLATSETYPPVYETTTTTIPFDSVPETTTSPVTVPDTTAVISPPAELPRTGPADIGLAVLAAISLSFLGFVALRYGRRPE